MEVGQNQPQIPVHPHCKRRHCQSLSGTTAMADPVRTYTTLLWHPVRPVPAPVSHWHRTMLAHTKDPCPPTPFRRRNHRHHSLYGNLPCTAAYPKRPHSRLLVQRQPGPGSLPAVQRQLPHSHRLSHHPTPEMPKSHAPAWIAGSVSDQTNVPYLHWGFQTKGILSDRTSVCRVLYLTFTITF